MFPHIYVINLENRKDRKENCEQILNKQGLEHSFFNAVDGSKLRFKVNDNDAFLISIYDEKNEDSLTFYANPTLKTDGVFGCFFSHYRLCNQLSKRDEDYFIVFEDDIDIVDNFKQKVGEILTKTNNPDIIFLGFTKNQEIISKNNLDLNSFDDVVEFKQIAKYREEGTHPFGITGGGTFGYIISKKGCQKFLENCKDILFYPIDYQILCWDVYIEKLIKENKEVSNIKFENQLNIYFSTRDIVKSKSFDESNDSNIQQKLREFL